MDLIGFLTEPYSSYSWQEIALECTAMSSGILSVYFAKRENILVFPTGLLSTGIYVWICLKIGIYADAGINAYYFGMSIYGWYFWTRGTSRKEEAPISILSRGGSILVLSVFLLCFLALSYLLENQTDSNIPCLDAFTTSVFFVAMLLMARKKIEHWAWWITGNLVSIPLYIYKGLGITSLQYLVFLIIAIIGLIAWRKKLVA